MQKVAYVEDPEKIKKNIRLDPSKISIFLVMLMITQWLKDN